MTTIPSLAFGSIAAQNLDIAAKFLVAGALPSPSITANPTKTPAVPAIAVSRGILATLLPYFLYNSKLSADGTSLHSKFSLLLPSNPRLAAMLNDDLAGILPLTGAVNVANLVGSGVNFPATDGVISLETLIYSLARGIADIAIEQIVIAGAAYLKLSGDYNIALSGGGNPT